MSVYSQINGKKNIHEGKNFLRVYLSKVQEFKELQMRVKGFLKSTVQSKRKAVFAKMGNMIEEVKNSNVKDKEKIGWLSDNSKIYSAMVVAKVRGIRKLKTRHRKSCIN